MFVHDLRPGGPTIVAYAAISQNQDVSTQPRAFGRVAVSARPRGPRTSLYQFRQQGSAKALFPKTFGADLQAVLLNTAGGVTGGDDFGYSATVEDDGFLTLATQTAERAYRAQPGLTGRVRTHLTAGAGARINWLPQETILFDGCNLSRRFEVDLAPSSTLLAVEPLVLGRKAMGERLDQIGLSDTWRIRRDGKLIYADSLRLHGSGIDLMNRPVVLDGASAMATVLLATQDADRHLPILRDALPENAGASLIRPGVLIARLVADDGFALRKALIPVLELLRGAPLPTVWKM